MKNLPKTAPDPLGVTIIKMTFASPPEWYRGTYYPQISGGYDVQAATRSDAAAQDCAVVRGDAAAAL